LLVDYFYYDFVHSHHLHHLRMVAQKIDNILDLVYVLFSFICELVLGDNNLEDVLFVGRSNIKNPYSHNPKLESIQIFSFVVSFFLVDPHRCQSQHTFREM
jgi:hypothetical protein